MAASGRELVTHRIQPCGHYFVGVVAVLERAHRIESDSLQVRKQLNFDRRFQQIIVSLHSHYFTQSHSLRLNYDPSLINMRASRLELRP